MRLYYVVSASLPHKKAYGIQIAKMCEAFIEAGVDLTLVVPRTRAARISSMREFYGLRVDVPTVTLPAIDGFARGRSSFVLSSLVFMCTNLIYLWWKSLTGKRGVVYTVDMDTFSFSLLPLSGMPVVTEMHEPKPANTLTRFFFRRARVIATNPEIQHALTKTFHIPPSRIIVEPNGVDLELFSRTLSREDARKCLALPAAARIVLYVGRFFDWKGLGILVEAATAAPEIAWYVVGGAPEEFRAVTGKITLPPNLYIAGESSHNDVSVWLAAADCLLVLGTKRNEQSFRNTAPMKVFEYMAARRPVVASGTPALKSFIPSDDVLWYEPDDVASLTAAVRRGISAEGAVNLENAYRAAELHTWLKRAEHIRRYI